MALPWESDSGDNGINPTTDLPWGVYPDAGSPTGYVLTATGQPVYKDGSAWNGSTSATKPSSGGGSTSPTNVYISQNPGNLYQTHVSDGSDGLPPGTVYQINAVTGDINIISKPAAAPTYSNPADKNNDGLDDSTNLANGVFPSSKSPTGYIYGNGQYVWPNGAPYTGSTTGGKPDAPTWTGYGPKGQGTYYLDGPGGTPGTYIGATTQAASGSSGSGGQTIKISGSAGGGGGGGGGTSSQYDTAGYRQMTQAVLEREAALAALKNQGQDSVSAEGSANRQFQAEQNALDRAQRQAEQAAAQRQAALGQFGSAVSDVDPAQFAAWMYANGFENGGSIQNRIAEGGNAISANALVRAAGLLDTIRGGNAGGAILGVPGGAGSVPGLPIGGVGNGGGTGDPRSAPAGATTAGGAGPQPGATPAYQPPTLLGNWRLMKDINGQPTVWQNFDTGAVMPWIPGETNAPTDYAGIPGGGGGPFRNGNWIRLEIGGTPVGWVNALTRERREYMPNDPNGAQLRWDDVLANGPTSAGQNLYNSLYYDAQGGQHVMGTGDAQYQLIDGQYVKVGGSEDAQLPVGIQSPQMAEVATKGGIPVPWTPGTFDATGAWKPSGMTQPTNNITTPGTAPVMNLADDNIQRGIELPNRTVVPGLARGGVTRAPMFMTGDARGQNPMRGGVRPEMIENPTGAPLIVHNANRTRAMMRGLMRVVPRFADGTDGIDWGDIRFDSAPQEPTTSTSAFYRAPYVPPLPTATTAGSSTTTSPVATTTPSTTSTASPVASSSSAPASGSTTPTQPAPQPVPPLPTPSGPVDVANQTPEQTAVTGAIANNNMPTDIGNIVNTGTTNLPTQTQLQEIYDWRTGQPVYDVSPLGLTFQSLDPVTQRAILAQYQTKYGIPAEAMAWNIQRNAIPGLSMSSRAVGY